MSDRLISNLLPCTRNYKEEIKRTPSHSSLNSIGSAEQKLDSLHEEVAVLHQTKFQNLQHENLLKNASARILPSIEKVFQLNTT